MGLRAALAIGLYISLCCGARAASITQTGADGAAGANGLDSPPAAAATNGGNALVGAPATATAGGNADASNDATATAGNGGAGGAGGNSVSGPVGAGGNGAAGGNANASADTLIHAGAALAQSQATGGAGGAGGAPGAFNGTYSSYRGQGGVGGNATASSSASNDGGTASANAAATAGAPGATAAGFFPNGGIANATATATSLGDADAHALGVGGPLTANRAQEVAAIAHASATSAQGDASATAEARGTASLDTFGRGGIGSPTAQAFAAHGDATATARSVGGSGYQGGLAFMVDTAVSGGAAGRLTLIQEAIGGDSTPAGGGEARSNLSATNPYGGSILGYSIATSGVNGSLASATIDASSTSGAPVEVHALGTSGPASHPAPCGGGSDCGLVVDRGALADARARILGIATSDLDATSTAKGFNSSFQNSQSFVSFTGGSEASGGGASLGTTALPYSGLVVSSIDQVSLALITSVTANRAAPEVDLSALQARNAEARTLLGASPSDVAAWTAGNPHASEALAAGGRVFALGSVALAGDAQADLSYSGSLSVSLDLAGAEQRDLALSFLDPSAIGSIDLLHLELRREGSIVFDETFSNTADALAALDDAVVPLLYVLQPGAPSELELRFDVSLAAGSVTPGFAFDLAFLSTPVPEPSPALLALAGAFAWLATRRSASVR